jgi:hypothetical protein
MLILVKFGFNCAKYVWGDFFKNRQPRQQRIMTDAKFRQTLTWPSGSGQFKNEKYPNKTMYYIHLFICHNIDLDLLAHIMEYYCMNRYLSENALNAAAKNFIKHGHSYNALHLYSILRWGLWHPYCWYWWTAIY